MSVQPPSQDNLALEGYKILVGMLNHEEDLFWTRNQAFLVINGALVTILGLIAPGGKVSLGSPKPIELTICLIGILICGLWFMTIRRSEAFYNIWYEQLKYLEKQYLKPLAIFQNAEEFFAQGRIKLGEQELRLDALAKESRIYLATVAAASILLVTWALLALSILLST